MITAGLIAYFCFALSQKALELIVYTYKVRYAEKLRRKKFVDKMTFTTTYPACQNTNLKKPGSRRLKIN